MLSSAGRGSYPRGCFSPACGDRVGAVRRRAERALDWLPEVHDWSGSKAMEICSGRPGRETRNASQGATWRNWPLPGGSEFRCGGVVTRRQPGLACPGVAWPALAWPVPIGAALA